jgi:tRNA pseudouridine38-40 synthase
MPVLAMTLAYHGGRLAGSQSQSGQRTVQGEVESSLAELFRRPTGLVLAGRTDRGVHAVGQVGSCMDHRSDLAVEVITGAVNARLADDIVVVATERRSEGFHARFDARWREYRYAVLVGPPNPMLRDRVWSRVERLDVARMAEGARLMIGEHDFAAMAGGGRGVPWSRHPIGDRGTTRNMLRCDCQALQPTRGGSRGALLVIRAVADGFLPHMVRNIVGALVEVGRGRRDASWIAELLGSKDRRGGPMTAPAHGLTFWGVGYGGDEPDDRGWRDGWEDSAGVLGAC